MYSRKSTSETPEEVISKYEGLVVTVAKSQRSQCKGPGFKLLSGN